MEKGHLKKTRRLGVVEKPFVRKKPSHLCKKNNSNTFVSEQITGVTGEIWGPRKNIKIRLNNMKYYENSLRTPTPKGTVFSVWGFTRGGSPGGGTGTTPPFDRKISYVENSFSAISWIKASFVGVFLPPRVLLPSSPGQTARGESHTGGGTPYFDFLS